MASQNHQNERILRIKEVFHKTGLSRSGLYDAIAKGYFPKPFKLTSRASGWLESEINHWIIEQAATRFPSKIS